MNFDKILLSKIKESSNEEYYTNSPQVKGITETDKQILKLAKYYSLFGFFARMKLLWRLNKYLMLRKERKIN